MALRARKRSGAFEKRAPGLIVIRCDRRDHKETSLLKSFKFLLVAQISHYHVKLCLFDFVMTLSYRM